MSKYAFILGQASRLAAAELLNVLNQPKNYLWQDNLLITETELAPESLLKQLGGTIKIAKIIASYQNLADFNVLIHCKICYNNIEKHGNLTYVGRPSLALMGSRQEQP